MQKKKKKKKKNNLKNINSTYTFNISFHREADLVLEQILLKTKKKKKKKESSNSPRKQKHYLLSIFKPSLATKMMLIILQNK
jgi:hypothetical protein